MKHLHYCTALSLIALAACSPGTVKETLGLDRSAPDEYRVVSRPPLTVPPEFNLQPPSSSDISPNEPSASQQAKALLQGKAGKDKLAKKNGSSNAESQFLKRAGADRADPTVRNALVEEKMVAQDLKTEHKWWDFFSVDDSKKEPIVNAKEEAKRIQKNEDEGKPVLEGKTPEVKPRDRGILDSILGD